MGFKMKGSPAKMGTISGTAGHSSALKMRVEQINTASALKQLADVEEQKKMMAANKAKDVNAASTPPPEKVKDKKMANKDWKKGQTKAKSEGGNLDALVKSRGGLKKGTPEYNKVQNKINSALGNKKRYDEGPAAKPTRTENVVSKGEKKKTNIAAKAAKKTGEVTENVTKKTSKISKRDARKEFGKGSKEHLAAKKSHLEAKEADRQGAEGGKKQGLFRKLSSKINKKRQNKTAKDLAKTDSPAKQADIIKGAKQAYDTVKKGKLGDVAKGFKGAGNIVKESAKSGFSDVGEGFRQLVTGDRVDRRKKKKSPAQYNQGTRDFEPEITKKARVPAAALQAQAKKAK